MAVIPGYKIDHEKSIPVNLSEDVTQWQVGKLTALNTAAVAGAGDYPAGVFAESVDISEDGTRLELVRGDLVPCIVAAAVSSLDIPLTTAASGTVTPCTTDKEPVVGKPVTLQSTVGGLVLVDLSTLGSYYTV